ncbi:efflux transporter outer membrane subunit [Nitrospirillum sp. BR 11163]|uniref:efflux transporter outer membrane subunit n=1 Tax=Nitrospirillum sp. BR 11163 TaxID=3104323 RepID=UPI002AFEFC2E|nr:efflux transporter outer membrane subunit [Nitrospirillum sp. BR 11163]MEA1672860.1 efflux transporter outer membrane subunit [Nitrospirillum sp. BR 11163]
MKAIIPGAFLLLTACSIGDDYVRPDTPQPTAWRTRLDAGPGWPSTGWWTRFNTSSLDALMAAAEGANLDVAAATARVRQADDTVRATGASLLPSVNGTAGASRARSPFGASAGTAVSQAPVANSFNLGLSISYDLDLWGKNRAAQEAAAAAAFQSRFDLRSVQLNIQANVAGTLFDLIGTQDRLAVARDALAGAERILTAIRRQRQGGMATALDETQQESQVESQRAAIPPLERQREQDRDTLALLVGRLGEDVPLPTGSLADIALPVIMPGLPSDLLARRPDVGSAEQQLVAAHADITVARAQLFPDITLTGSAGFQSLALRSLVHHTSLVESLGASVVQAVFDGDRLEAQVDYARDKRAEMLAGYRKTVLAAFLDVENALVALQKSAEEKQALQAYADKAVKANEISQRLLLNGTIDIVTVLNTQRTSYSARDGLVQARLAHLQAVLGLYRAMGGGWDTPAAED